MRPVALLLLAACQPAAGTWGPVDVATDAGVYALALTADPDPPVAGAAVLRVEVALAADAALVEGATVGVTPWMVEHGHGLSEDPVVTELGQGMYEAAFAYTMAGTWEVTVSVDAAAGADEATVDVEVQ